MKKIKSISLGAMLLIIALLIFGCSQDDTEDCGCKGRFGNKNTGEYIYEQTDCDRTPPSDDYVFINCVDKPGY